MLDARFSLLYFCQSSYALQLGLSAITGLLVFCNICTQTEYYKKGISRNKSFPRYGGGPKIKKKVIHVIPSWPS